MDKGNKIPRRIVIFGFSGSGKSTLADILGEKYGIDPTHLDSIHWLPGWKELPKEKMKRRVKEIIKKDKWIIEGNYSSAYMEERIKRADTVIFMELNRFICLYRVIKRYFKYRGKTRPDMGNGCPEKLDLEFIKWVLIDGRRNKFKFYKMLGDINIAEKNVYVMKSPGDVKRYLKIIQK
ncbi:MAG: DNA topology modulation protein FlaR [Oscillospiraceae bacterium]|nr:DNA topology modulation protein FlaR [Oscillospiraceae bacterium]